MRFTTSIRKILLGTTTALALVACDANKQTPAKVSEAGSEKADKMTSADLTGNSILQEWTGPYNGVPPWDKVKVSDFPQAFQAAMDKVKAEVHAVRDLSLIHI